MIKRIRKIYFFINLFIIFCIIVLWIEQKNLNFPYPLKYKWIQIVLSIFSVLFAMVLPMWMRILAFSFFSRKRNRARFKDFMLFEILTILSSSLAFVFTVLSYVWEVNLWVRYFVSFLGFYALYFSYPSDKKIVIDLKLFNLSKDELLGKD